ncbi:MAG TPA: 16S rRNA (cytosine(1402)-N(4))-methyltransferase RsmH [Xanthomonadales bacterium]|nr:16S rRNA (cytosine(1402)-N(4))-methyltransferase RsmH [Xanthomonadales bacterium]
MAAHLPVLRDEAIAALAIRADGTYLDGTFGRGGHAREILARLSPVGRLLVIDKDPDAIAHAHALFDGDARVAIRHGSFATLGEWSQTTLGLDGVLLDLGVSSPQLDSAQRGFSFQAEGPLDMRMDPTSGQSAAEFLAHADEAEIADVLWQHGEERLSRRIARAIVASRREAPLATTTQLATLVAKTIGHREPGKHPATRTFQALRIHVNRELDDLAQALEAATRALAPAGRLVVISFHSLEDRVVKRFIRDEERPPTGGRRGLPPPTDAKQPRLRAIGDAVRPSDAELARNPRARSATLRAAERIATS